MKTRSERRCGPEYRLSIGRIVLETGEIGRTAQPRPELSLIMDIGDIGVMFGDLVAFARNIRVQIRTRSLSSQHEIQAVLDHKVQALAKALASFHPAKEDRLKASKLNADFVACKKDCAQLRDELERYRPERREEEGEEEKSASVQLLPVQAYSLESKSAAIQAVAKDLVAIRSLIQDTASMIDSQGTDLTHIEAASERTVEDTGKAGLELQEAAKLQNKRWSWYIAGGLGTVGGLLGLIAGPVGVPIGAALGGSAGAALGKAIEKHENETVSEIKFDTK